MNATILTHIRLNLQGLGEAPGYDLCALHDTMKCAHELELRGLDIHGMETGAGDMKESMRIPRVFELNASWHEFCWVQQEVFPEPEYDGFHTTAAQWLKRSLEAGALAWSVWEL
jgi:hypothetical protein